MEEIDVYAKEFLIAKKDEIGRKELARLLEVTDRYVSQMATGERTVSKQMGVKLARLAGLTYQQMLDQGERLAKQKKAQRPKPTLPFQDELDQIGHHHKEAARFIYNKAGEELDVTGFATALIESLSIYPPGWDEYLHEEIDSHAFYETVKEYILKEVKKHKK